MRIKRIEMNGFKSFADKTEIDLGDGLTAVVGPNGSGKSNLAEAIKWVLGEQSARILRGTRMDDVIFSGTAKRKSVGFAEVSLVFDNSEGRLPVEFTEVVITRRVYRSGEGEYYINRKLCRLKDITELFLDTGIGKDSYSFVGQGRIDEILSADPRERRAIFEEAAGISRYKLRKRETENRLSETEHNLRRVLDISAELESQLSPLSIDADRAKQYLSLGERRRVWEKELLLYEMTLSERQAASLKTQIERAGDDALHHENELTATENKRAALSLRESALIAEVQDIEKQVFELRLLRQQRVERQEELALEVDKLKVQGIAYRSRVEQHELDLSSIEMSLKQHSAEYEDKKEQLRLLQLEMTNLAFDSDEEGMQSDAGPVEELKRAENEANQLQREELVQELSLQSIRAELKSKEQGQADRRHVLTQLRSELESLQQALEVQTNEAAVTEQKKAAAQEYHGKLKTQQGTLVADVEKLESALFQANNRLRALRSAESQMEGLGRGAKYILGLNLPGVVGVMGSLVTTSPEFETAIEVALGASIGDVVTTDEHTAKRAIALLKEKGQGRATFYPLDTIKPRPVRDVNSQLDSRPGYFGRAVDLVKVEQRLTPVVQQLLGNVLIVDSLDTATWVAKATNYSWRIVTLDGDVSLPGGSMTGGSRPERQAWMISRRRELEEAEARSASIADSLRSKQELLRGISTDVEKAWKNVLLMQAVLDKQAATLAEQRQKIVQVEGRLDYLEGEHKLAEQSIATLLQDKDIKNKDLQNVQDRLSVLSAAMEALKGQVQNLAQQEEQRRKQAANLRDKHTELKLQQVALTSEISAVERTISDILRQKNESLQRLDQARKESEDVQARIEELQQRSSILQNEISSLEGREKQSQELFDAKKAERAKLQGEQREAIVMVERIRQELNSIRQKLHNLELRIERVKAEQEFLAQKFATNYGGEPQEPSKLSSRNEAEDAIAHLDECIAALGAVRVSAIGEYERLLERVEFLSKQQSDLQQASAELSSVIAELDKVMGDRFLDGFAQVRKAFVDLAGRLFGGASAKLSLSDPERPLESGIDIDVQPPGKRLQSINLLSGGERALVAAALLCAVLRVKPTPFCILDEIDAPLDDANVDRLIPVLKELSATTQFLLVTHTKGTMMASDTLYGVTMPEQGVSKVLAVRVSEIAGS